MDLSPNGAFQETNIVNKDKVVKIPNWQEADQLAVYKAQPRS